MEFRSKSSTHVRGRKVSAIALEVRDKLSAIGGEGKLSERIWRARGRLIHIHNRWLATASTSRIKHLLYLEQRPQAEEVDDVRAAYVRFLPGEIEAHANASRRLAAEFIKLLALAEAGDFEFYSAHIDALRHQLSVAGITISEGIERNNRKP